LPSRWWCSSWSVSAGAFFLDLFCGGIVSCFSAETRWAPMLGVSENSDETPWTWIQGKSKRSSTQMMREETKNLLKTAHTSKVVYPFTCALAPPFIGRQRDFYISKIPLGPKEYS
jgi:hypothetical protein